jgi:hypothetical protein
MSQRSARLARPSVLVASLLTTAVGAALLPSGAAALGPSQQRAGQGVYDVRAGVAADDPSAPGAGASALARGLGPEGVVRVDPVNGTPRQLLRTDGALSRRSASAPATVALDFVRAHEGVFGLTGSELSALGAPSTTVSPAGVRRLRWTQSYRGVPVVGGELRASVAGDGRLISLSGAPLRDVAVASTTPGLTGAEALARVRRDAGAGAGAGAVGGAAAQPRLVIFAAHDGPRLAWKVRVDADSTHRYAYVLDADSGAILKRSNLVRFVSGAAGALSGGTWSYAPSDDTDRNPLFGAGAGIQQPRLFEDGWITAGDTRLKGDNAHVYTDIDDNDRAGTLEEIPANREAIGLPSWDFPFRSVPTGWDCSLAYPCSWASFVEQTQADGWQQNRAQNAVQAFWFINTYKEHLQQAPIGFDAASGNFSGNDFVIGNTDDGADGVIEFSDADPIDHHPDPDHLNNANMFTPPDGQSPRMQMYLFAGDNAGTIDANGGDDASIVYHEYTHGLSSRLVTDDGLPSGDQALNAAQAGAMGEAWSDWYAMDFLTDEGDQIDDPAIDGQVLLASYITQGRTGSLREAALDCPVGSSAPTCDGGGFTYADYGSVIGDYGPEVHADGEIWAQTLWDLRTALIDDGIAAAIRDGRTADEGTDDGIYAARALVTEGMRESPPEPSFLEMRDAILALIWEVFAARGMGWYAETLDANDPAPVANFDRPLSPATPTATLSGTITDADSGAPIAGAVVRLPGGAGLSDETDANGVYAIPAALVGAPYPRMHVDHTGYARTTLTGVTVAPGGSTLDASLRRNWALRSGGAEVAGLSGPDLTAAGCGPEDAIDGTGAYGWGSYQPNYDGSLHAGFGLPVTPTGPRRLVLRLPVAIDLSSFEIDPGAICGDDASASLGTWELRTSTDGTTWKLARAGMYTRANNRRLNEIAPNPNSTAGVRWVELTMLRPQGGTGSSATYFMDVAELGVYGAPTRAVDPPGPPDPPDPGDPQPENPPQGGRGPVDPGPRDPGQRTSPRPDPKPALSQAAVTLPRRRSLATFLGKAGVPLKLRADQRVRVIATITLPAGTARRLRMSRQKRGTVAIARLSNATVAANRTTTLHVRLPRNTRIWLQRARLRSLKFGVAILATASDGDVATKTLTATAKR